MCEIIKYSLIKCAETTANAYSTPFLLLMHKKPFITAVNAYRPKGCSDKDRKHSHRKHYLSAGQTK